MIPAMSQVNACSPSASTWQLIEKTADHIWDSGLAKDYRFSHRSSVVLVLLKGWELGLPLMSALEHVRVIHGHFSLSAECQQALVLARVSGSRFEWSADGKAGVAEVTGERPGHPKVKIRFTHEDAQKTGLAERNPIYKSFPANLLRSAAMRSLCKRLFPDVLLGLHAASETTTEADLEAAKASATVNSVTAPEGLFVATTTNSMPENDAKPALVAATHVVAEKQTPEDFLLPFTGGKWHGVHMSQLDGEGLGAMHRGFSKRLAEATEANDPQRVQINSEWLERVQTWASFRHVNLAA